MNTKENLSRLTIDISKEDHKKLKTIAVLQGKSMRDIVLESVELYLRDFEVPDNSTSVLKSFSVKQEQA